MSILGNGVDIVKNLRIKKLIKNVNFLNRIYTKKEIADSKRFFNKANFFAKRFAAKEAFVKSLGTGFRHNLNFNDISVKNKSSGKPELYINNSYINKIYIRAAFLYTIFINGADSSCRR